MYSVTQLDSNNIFTNQNIYITGYIYIIYVANVQEVYKRRHLVKNWRQLQENRES